MTVPGPFSIVFANAKGGVGKTTSAVHVAGAFAQSGVETLLVDLDPQASATLHVGLDPSALETTLTDVLIDPSRGIAPAVRATRYPGLSILPAHESLGTLESELGSIPDRESLLSQAWSGDLPYRVAVFDVPPALSLYTVNALKLADAVVIPVQTHPFALASVPRTMNLVDRVRRHLNPRLAVLGYVATLYDRRTRVARECLAKMMEDWGELLIEPPIPTNVALAEAARDGRLLFEADPESAGAAAYYQAAAEIVARWRAARGGQGGAGKGGARYSAKPAAGARA